MLSAGTGLKLSDFFFFFFFWGGGVFILIFTGFCQEIKW